MWIKYKKFREKYRRSMRKFRNDEIIVSVILGKFKKNLMVSRENDEEDFK